MKKQAISIIIKILILILIPTFFYIVISFMVIPGFPNTPGRLWYIARSQINGIILAINNFQLQYHRLPTEKEGIEILLPFLGGTKSAIIDPWGNKYMYHIPAVNSFHEYEIISYGADGKPGGSGVNTDIISWQNSKMQ